MTAALRFPGNDLTVDGLPAERLETTLHSDCEHCGITRALSVHDLCDGIEDVSPGVYRLHYQGRVVEVDDGMGWRWIGELNGPELTDADKAEIGERVDRVLAARGEL